MVYRPSSAMLIVQISDLHFLPAGTLAFGRVDVARCLERAIDHLSALRPQPDAVLITGDLTHDVDSAAAVWADLMVILKRIEAPLYPLPGNHDDREQMREAFSHLKLFPKRGPLCCDVGIGPIRLICLDSLIPGDTSGRLGREQLAWLDARLGEQPGKPTLVALHHPPFRTGIDHIDAMMLEDCDALAAVIERHPQVERVLCGHVHRTMQCRFAGTIGMVSPATAYAVRLALENEPARWIMEPPGLLLHEWKNGRGLVSQVAFIGSFETGRF